MGEHAQCTRDIYVNPQWAASEPLFENIVASPSVRYGRDKAIIIHALLRHMYGEER